MYARRCRAKASLLPNRTVKIHNIFTSHEHNYFTHEKFQVGDAPTLSHSSIECIEGRGLKGDRFEFSKYPITFISLEVATEVCKELEIELNVELFRRNIVISGVNLNALIGKRFTIANVEFEGLAHCAPCTWMNAVMKKGAYQLMRGRGGLRVKVITNGILSLGNHTLSCENEALFEDPLLAIKRAKLP